MARENQGYLIAVIVLVLIAVLTGLAAFLAFSKMNEIAQAQLAAEKKVTFYKALAEAQDTKTQVLQGLIGEGGADITQVDTLISTLDQIPTSSLSNGEKSQIEDISDSVRSIKEAYDKDFADFDTGDEDREPTYREILKSINQVVATQNTATSVQIQRSRSVEADAKSQITRKQQEVDAANAGKQLAEKELASEKQAFAQKESKLKEQVAEYTSQLENEKEKFTRLEQQSAVKVREVAQKVSELEERNQLLKFKINQYESEDYENPDGLVVYVADKLRSLRVNVGSTDGVTNNMTFSVYSASTTNFEQVTPKGRIEITRVTPYRSEARITQEDPLNPIVINDQILTPTWEPGYKVPIAVAGTFDLDGDGFDDYEKLIRMIERNGGEIVARHDTNGNITGKIDPTVRYLVEGSDRIETQVSNSGVASARKELLDQAEIATVQVINVRKMLSRMGVRATPQTVQYGVRTLGFKERGPATGSSTRGGSGTTAGGSATR